MSSDYPSNGPPRFAQSDEARVSVSEHEFDPRAFTPHAELLLRIARLAGEFDCRQISDDACSAAERASEGRFYVACVGQFKRGKSTLLNALVGENILPSGVVPITAVPTILRFGDRQRARVRLNSGVWKEICVTELAEYVSETQNPENRKGVAGLEVFTPSPLLSTGMCFVDTPGLGSVFEANSAATHAFLPHIDAAIAVIGADPPIAGDELELIEMVSKQVQHIVFVLNKADRVTEEEKVHAIAFARQVLKKRLQRPAPGVLEISALEQIQKRSGLRDWNLLLNALAQLSQSTGRQLIQQSGARSVNRLSEQLLMVIIEERDVLTRPIEESEKRLGQLHEAVAWAEQSLNDLGALFLAEHQRLSTRFADHRKAFLAANRPAAHTELKTALASLPRGAGPGYRRSAMHAAQEVARNRLTPWLKAEENQAREAYCRIAERFTRLANDFLLKVRTFRDADLAYLPKELNREMNFRAGAEFQFYEFVHVAIPASPFRYLADLVSGMVRAHSMIDSDAHQFLDRLLETNSERVRNDLENQIVQSRRELEAEIRTVLRESSAVAERALARARRAQAAGEAAIQSSLRRLAEAEAEVRKLGQSAPPQLAQS